MAAALFCGASSVAEEWREALAGLVPDLDFRVWPDCGDPASIDVLLSWRPPDGWPDLFPNLRLLQILGAGVDQVFAGGVPPRLAVARVIEPDQTRKLFEFVLGAVLAFHRDIHLYRGDRSTRIWQPRVSVPARERSVGIMGLGETGSRCAIGLASFGFQVRGWSRSPKALAGVASFVGHGQLAPFLAGSDILVCMLPLTPETRGILDAGLFAQLPAGACVINVGRGAHCREPDLIAAVRSGHLAGAWLDVTEREPLPPDDPLWNESRIEITPHVATRISVKEAAPLVAENIRRVRNGESLLHPVDIARGY